MTAPHRRRGTTLIELLVVLAVLAILTSVVTLSARVVPPADETSPARRIATARARATSLGRGETLVLRDDSGQVVVVRTQPDGSVLGARAWHVNRTTGEPTHAQP